jgi:hypothetical protein
MTSSTPRADVGRRSARWIAAAAIAITSLVPDVARASPEAEALFEEGKRLMGEGRIGEACRSFEKSFALDPLGGTLMGLAICHEKEGKLATALREFERARAIAEAAGRSDRVEHALRSIASLEPRVPRVIVEVPPESRVAQLEVKLDGQLLAPDEWNTARPIDPGPHRIEWSAPGRSAGSAGVDAREGSREQVFVRFEGATSTDIAAPSTPPSEDGGTPPTRIAAFVTGGVGLASQGASAVLGVVALGHASDSDADCDLDVEPVRCGPAGLDAFEAGETTALGADVALGAGLLLVGASVVLFLWPTDDGTDAAAGDGTAGFIRAAGAPGRASLVAGGRF